LQPEEPPIALSPLPFDSLLPPLDPLILHFKHSTSPIHALTTLPPQELLHELLGRALHSGIGRLYFERQLHHGRVLWSQSGVLQSVLEDLDATTFQGLINELKLMNHLSLIPIKVPKQVEIERLYQQTRLLLRFRFMAGEYGEEATLQVLRGAALRFYQQQQLVKLERDALTIARQLQTKMSEIRDRAQAEPGLQAMKLEALPALAQLLHTIEAQIGALQEQANPKQDKGMRQ
jgi:type II secretory ATPase GspE/PulE/Tfp pilus assembly ATPase PilB-like protein